MNKSLVIYIHGKNGTTAEADFYKNVFYNYDVIGFDYTSTTPWQAKKEFTEYFDSLSAQYDKIVIVANSIGAYFTMNAHLPSNVEKAYFISPIVDMEKLIYDMMTWTNVTETQLQERKSIPTNFGETLSYEYLNYVKNNKTVWDTETYICYGEKDNLTSHETIYKFAKETNSKLSVMKNGEHWFHTEEQMNFIKNWLNKNIKKDK